ncbi:alpha/beta hydrolase [Ruania alba]|uniref:Pimeloyl-ACP methyl ester carboxylesterase n=1 Tax=Ruania alba TaxID=648782 RepID=A0A1H5MF72_9MICO|nr:alpha/beta hydrolase [Ruania alba]SEE87954.1 Pimeloyl-ACP methyl ester carboxylesterase [Ruania alba]
MTATHTLSLPDVELVYDVHGPLPTADGRPPLVAIGQPMDASGFAALAARSPDRTVVAYDPRGLGRSTRSDGRVDSVPQTQAEDLHALVAHLNQGPVDVFASSGGAVTGLAWVSAYPDDVRTLVAHEPPLITLLPDAQAAARAFDEVNRTYAERGWGHGMAAFVAMTMWSGEFTEAYFAQDATDPAAMGMPTEDDGSRDDPLLSGRGAPITDYRPDAEALAAATTRLVVAVGEETGTTITGRTTAALASLLGQEPVLFPGGHGGFLDDEFGYPGKPDEFAERLREVLSP